MALMKLVRQAFAKYLECGIFARVNTVA